MILLLDTSKPTCHLVTVKGEQVTEKTWEAGRGLARGLLTFIRDSLAEVDSDVYLLTGIGVMRGPGSFTGLRIGLTVANTLADSLGVPIVGEAGEGWLNSAVNRLKKGEDDRLVMPMYGGEAHITQPKK